MGGALPFYYAQIIYNQDSFNWSYNQSTSILFLSYNQS